MSFRCPHLIFKGVEGVCAVSPRTKKKVWTPKSLLCCSVEQNGTRQVSSVVPTGRKGVDPRSSSQFICPTTHRGRPCREQREVEVGFRVWGIGRLGVDREGNPQSLLYPSHTRLNCLHVKPFSPQHASIRHHIKVNCPMMAKNEVLDSSLCPMFSDA